MCMIILVSLCKVFEKLKAIWATVVRAASTYMKEQTSRHHFEFFGLDLIADTSGRCWLIEINRCASDPISIFGAVIDGS